MRIRTAVIVSLACAAGAGCEGKSEECQKARNASADAWKAVMEKAGTLENSPGPGFEDLDENAKARHVKTFDDVEKQADLVFKSFAFEKITWDTAEPARKKANDTFAEHPQKSDYEGFAGMLESANARFEEAAKQCK